MAGRQQGLSLMALIFVLALLVVAALFAMKVIPSYLEFRAAKTAIDAIAREKQGATAGDIRRAFENRSAIDDINTVKPTDLEISKEGNAIVISFAYRKEVPLFSNVGLYIDYAARAGGQ
jgi:Tfp pilus assembly protein FimT